MLWHDDTIMEITEQERAALWAEAGEKEEPFLDLLIARGYGDSRLAGQVNLLVHVMRRAFVELRDLHWRWAEVDRACHVTHETFRKLRIRVSAIQQRTKWAIEGGLGWEPGSVDACLTMGTPVVDENWRPPGSPRTARTATPALDVQRTAFTYLGLTTRDLDTVLARFDAGDEPARKLASAIHQAMTADIDPAFRGLLLDAARARIVRTLDDERQSTASTAAEMQRALDTVPRTRR